MIRIKRQDGPVLYPDDFEFHQSYSMYNDLDGNPVKRTPLNHPYSFDAYVIWGSRGNSNNGAYSDRIYEQDYEKATHCWNTCIEGKTKSQRENPRTIEKYLRLYFNNPEIKLCYIIKDCNNSSGYELYYYGWYQPKDLK